MRETKETTNKQEMSQGGVLLTLFVKYTIETVMIVVIFTVFSAASMLTRWLNKMVGIPEFMIIGKIIELAILVFGSLLCLYTISMITFEFIRNLWKEISDKMRCE